MVDPAASVIDGGASVVEGLLLSRGSEPIRSSLHFVFGGIGYAPPCFGSGQSYINMQQQQRPQQQQQQQQLSSSDDKDADMPGAGKRPERDFDNEDDLDLDLTQESKRQMLPSAPPAGQDDLDAAKQIAQRLGVAEIITGDQDVSSEVPSLG